MLSVETEFFQGVARKAFPETHAWENVVWFYLGGNRRLFLGFQCPFFNCPSMKKKSTLVFIKAKTKTSV